MRHWEPLPLIALLWLQQPGLRALYPRLEEEGYPVLSTCEGVVERAWLEETNRSEVDARLFSHFSPRCQFRRLTRLYSPTWERPHPSTMSPLPKP